MITDRFEAISLKREELYEAVWTTPVVQIAKRYGLSDVAIGKICKKHSIPKPPPGYWAKVSHGKTLPRPPLPTIVDDRFKIVEIHQRPTQAERQSSPSGERSAEVSIPVPERLMSPHPLVGSTLTILKTHAPNQNGIVKAWAKQCLDVSVGRNSIGRAMRIMDTLLKALERQGHSTSVVEKDRKHFTCVQVLSEAVEIQLRETLNRREKQFTVAEKKERERSSWLRDRIEYEYFPSGRLSLNILNYLGVGYRRLWSDGKKQHLEDCLASIVAGVHAAADAEKARRLQREQREKEQKEHEARRIAEQERKRKEEEKIHRLEYLVDSWTKSQNIRRFLSAIEKAYAERSLVIDPASNLADWLSWVRNYAETIDPIDRTLRANSETAPGDRTDS